MLEDVLQKLQACSSKKLHISYVIDTTCCPSLELQNQNSSINSCHQNVSTDVKFDD